MRVSSKTGRAPGRPPGGLGCRGVTLDGGTGAVVGPLTLKINRATQAFLKIEMCQRENYYQHNMSLSLNLTGDIWLFKN